MPKWLRYLLPVALGVYAAIELWRLWSAGATGQGWVELAGFHAGMTTILIAWIVADRRASAGPLKDGPEADYHDARGETH